MFYLLLDTPSNGLGPMHGGQTGQNVDHFIFVKGILGSITCIVTVVRRLVVVVVVVGVGDETRL